MDDKNIIEEAQEEVKEDVVEDIDITEDKQISFLQSSDEYVTNQIAKELGVKSEETTKYDRDLQLLLEYAKIRGAKTLTDALWEIRQLQNRVGKSPYGSDIKKLSRYAYLFKEQSEIEKELGRYGNN